MSAGAELVSRAHLIHERPPYGIDEIICEGRSVPVREKPAHTLFEVRLTGLKPGPVISVTATRG